MTAPARTLKLKSLGGLIVMIVLLTSPLSVSRAKTVTVCASPDRSEVHIPGGTFLMGSNEHEHEEGPVHRVTVAGFSIDRFDITNAQFARFVAATGYVTDAERKPDPRDYPEILRDKLTSGGAIAIPSCK